MNAGVYSEIPPIARMVGYEMKTSFWKEFTVAERLSGIAGVKETFSRSFESWKDDKIYGTELCLVLNWKAWEHAEHDIKLAKEYDKMWRKLDGYICSHWKGEKLSYFLATTD